MKRKKENPKWHKNVLKSYHYKRIKRATGFRGNSNPKVFALQHPVDSVAKTSDVEATQSWSYKNCRNVIRSSFN